ncbi:MAG TPA: type II toxin-antitoxin system PemK/MazF family toxin [Myxococcota bacterium]|nr:type II toxin-antitoxin system PemK/MazF family toxin [Myxococcota bacterium]
MKNELRRGDVVLVEFPFGGSRERGLKKRPALVVQHDRYNRRRSVVILAAITSSRAHHRLPSKVPVTRDSPEGQKAGILMDSVVDCQTLVTIPTGVIIKKLGSLPEGFMHNIDAALKDALGIRN